MATEKSSSRSWMSDAAIYQIYPRSFKDSTGSGLGDIAGITQQMDYLERLGIEAIWLSPFYPSPHVDGGYDVADYCDVDQRLGSLDDFDDMIAAAHTRGIKVIVDIVPNHSSNQHPWFKAALAAGPGSPERARYIFRDGRGEHGELPPTNWNANFGGPAWTRVADGQWYLHMFTPEQPDFDWSCPEVRAFFCDVLAFWSDRGVDGFRIDVAHGLAKDFDRDDLDQWHLAEGDDMVDDGTHPLWDRNEVHEIYREWRRVFDRYNPPRSAVAEAWVLPERQYLYARPSELGQTFNFEFAKATWTYDDMHAAIEEGLKAAIESDSASTWVLSNHDVPRVATRYALPQIKATRYHQIALDWLLRDGSSYDEDRELGERRARAALLLELALPGSAYVYQGEELGLFEVADIPWAALEDPTATNTRGPKREKGRDGCRVPLPWVAADDPAQGGSFGFSPADADAAPDLMSASFGQSVSVTALQMAQGYLTLLNNGVYKPLRLLREQVNVEQRYERIFSERVCREVMGMMRDVVEEKDGTGKRARIEGVEVAGKTGTAQKADHKAGSYGAKRLASFVGFLPADNPRYLIVVLVDEPTKNQYGGVVAAPVFREIASRAITYSGAIVPDATSQAEKDDKPDKDKGRQRGLKLSRLDVPFLAKEDVQTSRPPSMQQPGHLAKASSRVPDVKGKTVRNAVELFARAGIVPELKGTGTRVVRQSPPPGTAWPKEGENVTYILWLSER